MFAIGSAPIDFTHAALLVLRDEGKLSFDDPITNYFNNVPVDKQSITIQHLMSGQSGLRDFHDPFSIRSAQMELIVKNEATLLHRA